MHSDTPTHSTSTGPRALIADDERLMREQLRARLAEVWPELQIVAEARNGLEAVALVEQHRPEIVFLDIRMPGLTGVDAARQIAQMAVADDEVLPEVVFITAYDQYAVEALSTARPTTCSSRPSATGCKSPSTESAAAWPSAARPRPTPRRRSSNCCTPWPRA